MPIQVQIGTCQNENDIRQNPIGNVNFKLELIKITLARADFKMALNKFKLALTY